MTKSKDSRDQSKTEIQEPLIAGRDGMAHLMGFSTATFDRLNSSGRIGPRPIRISTGRIGWRLDTVKRWVAACEEAGELIGRKDWLARDGSKA